MQGTVAFEQARPAVPRSACFFQKAHGLDPLRIKASKPALRQIGKTIVGNLD